MDDAGLNQKRALKVTEFLVEELDGETVLFSPQAARTVHLNPSSRLIWDLCDGQRTVAAAIEMLANAFPDDAEQIRRDVAVTLRRFEVEGIIRWA